MATDLATWPGEIYQTHHHTQGLRPTGVTANSRTRNMYKAHMGRARVNRWTALFLMNSM